MHKDLAEAHLGFLIFECRWWCDFHNPIKGNVKLMWGVLGDEFPSQVEQGANGCLLPWWCRPSAFTVSIHNPVCWQARCPSNQISLASRQGHCFYLKAEREFHLDTTHCSCLWKTLWAEQGELVMIRIPCGFQVNVLIKVLFANWFDFRNVPCVVVIYNFWPWVPGRSVITCDDLSILPNF